MHVTQEGPDVLSLYCPVQAFGLGEAVRVEVEPGEPMCNMTKRNRTVFVGGVDTHKDLHVAAVVDERDRVPAS
jgi:hypothetical protein